MDLQLFLVGLFARVQGCQPPWRSELTWWARSNMIRNVCQSHKPRIVVWLVVSTHLKNISQIGSFPRIGMKIKNIWNHHLVVFRKLKYWTLFGESAHTQFNKTAQSTKRFLPSFLLGVGLEAHNCAHKTLCKLKPSPCKEASKFQHKYSSCRVLWHTTSLHQTMKSVKLQVHASKDLAPGFQISYILHVAAWLSILFARLHADT